MPELLKTKRIGSELEDLISSAHKYICIFTYSLIIDDLYLERLKAASKREVEIVFVFGVEPKNIQVLLELQKLKKCRLYFKEYMHAKFYYNEQSLIIATMNLSEISERKNYEIGLLFKKEKSPEIFEQIASQAKEIIGNATPWTQNGRINYQSQSKQQYLRDQNERGYCIRCREKIKLDPAKPLCFVCYDTWADWENQYYEENFCHTCGNEKDFISYAKPRCNSCYHSGTLSFSNGRY